ncbi:MAG: TetR family transcriptional regulator [Alphaproteobacteria bacterium]|nr:TetR family transcriptional regulator [Alphaproteobacteria bacterium]
MKPHSSSPATLPLRELKKQRTRKHIIDIAAALFHERGFEAVTVAEIAQAAEVGEQTVYNYFTTKEGLVFDEADAFVNRVSSMILEAPQDQPLMAAIRAEALAFLASMSGRSPNPSQKGGMPYLIVTNAVVRKGWLALIEQFSEAAADALGARTRGKIPPAAASVIGKAIVSVFAVIVDQVGCAIRDKADVDQVVVALRPQIEMALSFLENGLGSGEAAP